MRCCWEVQADWRALAGQVLECFSKQLGMLGFRLGKKRSFARLVSARSLYWLVYSVFLFTLFSFLLCEA